ncbi:MAG TPA: benzoate-CoA ligase family protein [Candidatus Binatia bacterium]|nr:benzoate-CoA ligase family protein [Candidatus Binatia bacterium]
MANAVSAFLDDTVAGGAADRPAIVTPAGATTYREMLRLAARCGNVLRGLGLEAEQRVALLLPDGVEWAAAFFGALRIGAVAVPLNTRLGPAQWVALLRDSRARVLIAEAALLGEAKGALTELPHLRAVLTTGPGAGTLGALLAAAAPECPLEAVSGDDTAFWLYTSGTTGGPKAAVHLHRDLLACRHYGLDVLGVGDRDRVLATSKLFFAYALGNALLLPFYAGAVTWLDPAWPDQVSVPNALRAFQPTLFFSVPTFYGRLLRAGLPADAFRSVRACVSAGERLPAELYEAWRARFGVEILDGLGASETIFMVLSNRPGKSRAGSAGVPVPGTEARLLDADGRAVGDGEPGVLHVRTPSASPGYWNRLDLSRRAFQGEWFRTGDVMTRDADGFYHHAGRDDDLFKVAGQWVAPGDVEAALLAHPHVAEAGVVGVPAEAGLVKPVAFVVGRGGDEPEALAAALAAHLAATLPSHQRPRRIAVVDELPRTVTGKLQRHVLREWAERTL